MIAYHVTNETNLPSIIESGLQPQLGALARQSGESEARVFLYATLLDAEDGIVNFLAEHFDDVEEATGHPVSLVVLELDVTGLIDNNDVQLGEVSTSASIPADRILKTFGEDDFICHSDEVYQSVMAQADQPSSAA